MTQVDSDQNFYFIAEQYASKRIKNVIREDFN